MKTKAALVVLSGGQDSTTCLYWAKKYFSEVHAITFDYGQRHGAEIMAARQQAILGMVASHEIITLGPILKGTSPLTDPTAELEQYPSFEVMEQTIGSRIEKTFVPMRNALFLTIAANRAALLKADIITGVCQEDNANYPDCRLTFLQAQELMINEALGTHFEGTGHIQLLAPLMNLTKAESIKLAVELGCYAKLAFTHTAYDGQYPPVGNDHATMLRAEGFKISGYPDPLIVRALAENRLSALPNSANYRDPELWSMELIDEILGNAMVLRGEGLL